MRHRNPSPIPDPDQVRRQNDYPIPSILLIFARIGFNFFVEASVEVFYVPNSDLNRSDLNRLYLRRPDEHNSHRILICLRHTGLCLRRPFEFSLDSDRPSATFSFPLMLFHYCERMEGDEGEVEDASALDALEIEEAEEIAESEVTTLIKILYSSIRLGSSYI
ncbi:hypothetical protein QQ045_020719 [Rhodiola kirilowii]